MAKIYGQLENAQLENKAADYATGVAGRYWLNTTSLLAKFDTGAAIKTLVDTDTVQTLSNKSIDVAIFPHQATPAAPVAGNIKLYSKNNGKIYILRETGSESALGGGGGGGSLLWEKTGGISPVAEFVDGFHLENFNEVDSQEIYAFITVPESYDAGAQIKLLSGSFFISAVVGNVRFRCDTTLIRDASTVLGTYPNIHSSVLAEVTVPAVSNTLKAIGEIDLSAAGGLINGVAIVAGDKLRVRLYRDRASETVPAAADAKLLINNFQLRFSV